MKKFLPALALSLMCTPFAAQAQDNERSALAGPHIGIDVARNSLEARQPTSTRDADRKGLAVRGNIGYDVALGNVALIGVEAGIGTGGRTVSQASLAGGRYTVNPGMTYDLTGRLGVMPSRNIALYGRTGYRWLKTEQTISGQTANNSRVNDTKRGFTYGGGVEFAISPNVSLRTEYLHTKFNRNLKQSGVSTGISIRF